VVVLHRQVDLIAVVCPRTELHRTELVVEREPTNVDRTRRDEEAEDHPGRCGQLVESRTTCRTGPLYGTTCDDIGLT